MLCDTDNDKTTKLLKSLRPSRLPTGVSLCVELTWKAAGVQVIITNTTVSHVLSICQAKQLAKEIGAAEIWLSDKAQATACWLGKPLTRTAGAVGTRILASMEQQVCWCGECSAGKENGAIPRCLLRAFCHALSRIAYSDVFWRYSGSLPHSSRYRLSLTDLADVLFCMRDAYMTSAFLDASSSVCTRISLRRACLQLRSYARSRRPSWIQRGAHPR